MATAAASPSSSGPSRFGKNAFFFIIVTVFIDMMAFAVIMPSMPELMAELLNGKDALFAGEGAWRPRERQARWRPCCRMPLPGAATSPRCLCDHELPCRLPILGGLSDRFGRRPILLISIGTLAIDFVIMGIAHSIWLLFLGRILSGISGATHSTAAAYIADVTEPKARGGKALRHAGHGVRSRLYPRAGHRRLSLASSIRACPSSPRPRWLR
jgi:DHA1 family tetracycline resistance protein-like MFS transporter